MARVLRSARNTDPVSILIINIDRPMIASPRAWAMIRARLPRAQIVALSRGADTFVQAAMAAGVISLRPHTVTCRRLRRTLRRASRGLADHDRRLLEQAKQLLLAPNNGMVIRVWAFTIDLGLKEVGKWGKRLRLSRTDFEVLACHGKRLRQAMSTDELLQTAWGLTQLTGRTKAQVKNSIIRLRQKIERSPHHPRYILTDRTRGYLLQDPALIGHTSEIEEK